MVIVKLPVMVASFVSVPVIVCWPDDCKVAVNVWTPESPAVNV